MPLAAPLPLDVKCVNWVTRALFWAFGAMALVSLGWWLAQHPAWTVGRILVVGEVAHQNEVTLRSHLASQLRGSFLTLDLQQVKRVFESVPWVRQAIVQRDFPNRLRVTLLEHQPRAWWGESGGGKLVNAQGQVFEANPDDVQADGWSELTGPDDSAAPQVYRLHQALQPLFARLDWRMQRLELDRRGGWRVRLAHGTVVELGRGNTEELLTRVTHFVFTVSQLSQRYAYRLEMVDLRYPNGYAVRMRGVTTTGGQDAPVVSPVRPPSSPQPAPTASPSTPLPAARPGASR